MVFAGIGLLTLLAGPTGEIHLKNGDRLSALGVFDSRQLRAWTTNGIPVGYKAPEAMAMFAGDKPSKPQPNPDNVLAIVFKLVRREKSDSPSVAFRRVGDSNWSPTWTLLDPGRGDPQTWTAGLSRPFDTESIDLMVGVSEARWKTVSRYSLRQNKLKLRIGVDISAQMLAYKPGDVVTIMPGSKVTQKVKDEGFRVTVKLPSTPSAYRVVALDRNGRDTGGGGSMTSEGSKMATCYWFGGKPSNVARIEFQTRPYEWTTFRDIRLRTRPMLGVSQEILIR